MRLNPNRLIDIITHFAEIKSKIYQIKDADDMERYQAKPNCEITTIRSKWKVPSWGEHRAIYESSLVPYFKMEELMYRFDGIIYRDRKLKICLKKWDFKGENKKDIPITEEVIDNMDATVAMVLVEDYDNACEINDKELKRLESGAYNFFEGKDISSDLLPVIYEHIMVKHTKLKLEDIRAMDYNDFQVHLRLSLVSENLDREFKMALQGINPKRTSKPKAPRAKDIMDKLRTGTKITGGKASLNQRFDPEINDFVDQ